MTESGAPGQPVSPLHGAGPNRSSLLHVLTLPVASGLIESPTETYHAIDIHLGDPVQASCRMDGREQRGVQRQGLFCILPAGVTGRWLMSRPASALLLLLAPSVLRDAADSLGLRAPNTELWPSIYVRDAQIERIAWIVQAEHDAGYPSGPLFTDSLAVALAVRLLARQSGAPNAVSTSGTSAAAVSAAQRALPARRLRDVLDYIEAHLHEPLTLASLAGVAGFSASHFKALFKQAVGVPVHRYVVERRVERARVLVLDGRRSMAEIAAETGFAHQSHMARCMRRLLGLGPSQLAASAR